MTEAGVGHYGAQAIGTPLGHWVVELDGRRHPRLYCTHWLTFKFGALLFLIFFLSSPFLYVVFLLLVPW